MFPLIGLFIGAVIGACLGFPMMSNVSPDDSTRWVLPAITVGSCGLMGLAIGALVGGLWKTGGKLESSADRKAAREAAGTEKSGGSGVMVGVFFVLIGIVSAAAKGCRFGQSMRENNSLYQPVPPVETALVQRGLR